MALDVIERIKAAEEKALETRRTAAAAAKDSLRIASEKNAEIMEKELSAMRQKAAADADAAGAAAEAELKASAASRQSECEQIKSKAETSLSRAADVCLERILE